MIGKKERFHGVYSLTGESIDRFSEELEAELLQMNIERRNRLRIRLSLEEALLRFRDRFGAGKEFRAKIVSFVGKPVVQVTVKDDVFNPLNKEQAELNDWSGALLMTAGLNPQFSYSRGINTLRIAIPAKKFNPVLKIITAIATGVLTGLILVSLIHNPENCGLTVHVLKPLFDLWNTILLAISGPVIFFMVSSTMLNMRSVSEQGGDSRAVVMRYFSFSFIAAIIAASIGQILYQPEMNNGSMTGETAVGLLESLFENIVPENVFSPIIDANTPQILLMAFVLGTAVLVIGPKAEPLAQLIQQMNMVGMLLAEWISLLVPYFAGILIVYQILCKNTILLGGVWRPLLTSLVIACIFVLAIIVIVGLRKGASPKLLIKKIWEPFKVTLLSGSLDASFGLSEHTLITKLGIEKNFTNVSLPHGLVMYMPVNVIGTLVFTMFAASHFNVTVSALWFGVAIILAIILFVTTPPVPGANLIAYIAIFAQLGIASEALIDAMIFDIIFGIFASAANQVLLQMDLIFQADKIGLLNLNILRKE